MSIFSYLPLEWIVGNATALSTIERNHLQYLHAIRDNRHVTFNIDRCTKAPIKFHSFITSMTLRVSGKLQMLVEVLCSLPSKFDEFKICLELENPQTAEWHQLLEKKMDLKIDSLTIKNAGASCHNLGEIIYRARTAILEDCEI